MWSSPLTEGSRSEMGLNRDPPWWERGTQVPLYREGVKDSSASSHKWGSCLFPLAGPESQKFFHDLFSGPHSCFFWKSVSNILNFLCLILVSGNRSQMMSD